MASFFACLVFLSSKALVKAVSQIPRLVEVPAWQEKWCLKYTVINDTTSTIANLGFVGAIQVDS